MTLPTPAGTEKYTFSPVVNHIALNGKIGTTVTTKPGYGFPGGLTSKVFAATPDNTGYVFFSHIVGHHVSLPDVFGIDETASGWPGYWSTKVSLTIVNDTASNQEFRIRYADQQDGNRVWAWAAASPTACRTTSSRRTPAAPSRSTSGTTWSPTRRTSRTT